MKRRVLDSSILIRHWRLCRGKTLLGLSTSEVERWARRLIAAYDSNAIVTPVYVELLAGVANKLELELTRAYLQQFQCIDRGIITPDDWKQVSRLAQRVPRNRRPRNLGDCLIRAIADRLHYTVTTLDQGFPS